jgi:hypothetical protein
MLLIVLSAVLLAGLGACSKDPTPTPTPEAEAVSQWPTFKVISSVVEYRPQEAEEPIVVDPGTDLTVEAGANILVGEDGHAVLQWEGFLTNELLADTDSLLSLSLPAEREVMIDQASGTARYVLQGEGEPANVLVKAQWTEILADEGVADFFVSLVPGPEPAVWVVVREGKAAVTRDDAMITLHAGEAAAFTEEGSMPDPMEIDLASLMSWYDDAVEGQTENTIVSVVFRCEVDDDVALRAEPSEEAEELSEPLPEKTDLAVIGRNLDGSWVYVRVIDTGETGWLPISELDCVGPVLLITVVDAVEEAEVQEPTATTAPPPAPTVIYVTPTPPPAGTPSVTPTPSGEFKIKFWADDTSIKKGECTNVHWETNNIREVYYNGGGVPGNGHREECPDKDTTYTLDVILTNGEKETHHVTVKVDDGEDKKTNTPKPSEPTSTSEAPQATNTAYVPPTPEPPTDVPAPTDVPPTDVPAPTDVPPTDVPPTAGP